MLCTELKAEIGELRQGDLGGGAEGDDSMGSLEGEQSKNENMVQSFLL